MEIRKYKSSDHRQLSQMILALYQDDPEGEAMDQAKIERTIEVLTKFPMKGQIEIIESHNRIVGYGLLINQWSNEHGSDILHIDELYIIPEARGRGLGTKYVKRIIQTNEKKVIALETTPSNRRVRDFYYSLGFVKATNDHLFYYKN